MIGRYEVDARILFLNIVGSGPFHANVSKSYELLRTIGIKHPHLNFKLLADLDAECVLDGKRTTVANDNYVLFKPLECIFTIQNASVFLDELFSGNPLIGKATNDIINEHILVFLEEIKPALLKSITDVFTSLANKITRNFKASDLYLP